MTTWPAMSQDVNRDAEGRLFPNSSISEQLKREPNLSYCLLTLMHRAIRPTSSVLRQVSSRRSISSSLPPNIRPRYIIPALTLASLAFFSTTTSSSTTTSTSTVMADNSVSSNAASRAPESQPKSESEWQAVLSPEQVGTSEQPSSPWIFEPDSAYNHVLASNVCRIPSVSFSL